MTNAETKKLFYGIRGLLRQHYPLPENSDIDVRFAMTIGLIWGAIDEALEAVEQDRPLKIMTRSLEDYVDVRVKLAGNEFIRLASKYRDFLLEERRHLMELFCVVDEEGEPRPDTMEPDDALHVERIDKLLGEVKEVLDKETVS